jgi:Na+/H+-dicarboxylate symporter
MFHEVPIPILRELQAVLVKVVTRIMRLLPARVFLLKSKT